jgi:hypothetical protein
MSLWSERSKVDRMRKSWTGALRVAGGAAKRKFPSGTPFFGSVAGGTKRATNSPSRRKKRVSAIVETFKRGWTCTMPKREERHAQCSPTNNTSRARSVITAFLRCKENFACVRIFYFASRWKTGDVDVTAIWRERTGNPAWVAGHGSSIRQLSFLLACG